MCGCLEGVSIMAAAWNEESFGEADESVVVFCMMYVILCKLELYYTAVQLYRVQTDRG